MNKLLLSLIFSLALLGLAGSVFASPTTIDNPLGNTSTIGGLLEKITLAVAGIIGSISVIMLIVAGVMFVTSGGNPGRVSSAKTALFYAIAGIMVSLAATAIINTIKYIIGAP